MARTRRSAPASKAPASKPSASAAKTSTSAPVTAASTAPAAVPAPAKSGGMMGGLLGTVVEGMAMGTGSAIARHAVNSAMDSFGSSDKEQPGQQLQQAPAPQSLATAAPICVSDQKAFMECLNTRMNDILACQFYLDALNTCKQQTAFQ